MLGQHELKNPISTDIKLTKFGLERTRCDFLNINLPAKTGKIEVSVLLRKLPIDKIISNSIIDKSVIIGESEKLTKLMGKAQEIIDLPLEKKLKELMKLTRSTIKHYGKSESDELRTTQEEEFNWLDQNITPSSHYRATLAEAIEHGYGICGHFTALYALLAQQAGLRVVINHASGDMTPLNIVRSDNNLPLFKNTPLGEKTSAHVFLEVLDDNRAIPVDPTVDLIGFSESELEMFKRAKYYDILLGYGLGPEEKLVGGLSTSVNVNIPAGSLVAEGKLRVNNYGENDFFGNLSFNMSTNKGKKESNGGLIILSLQ